ncbi:DegT/DnrJ/EryC1/StrS family aminotransferase [Vibrio mexicanus]|uniref:DegT/DnrJ/EryC1/StrS family aminotransferase n=1 Tax=Vibrio mexicanus TaxID=1004326 RepID=UPI00063CE0F4|nr:DegT/DnrJ/EryC1/StrS family aminotransferase [Vibrio mexicanus]
MWKGDSTREPIYVTKPLKPNLEHLSKGLNDIYSRGILTNSGPLNNELEFCLNKRLGGEEFLLFNNGTIALMAAIAALELPEKSEIITTPFTFAATVHAITSLGYKPVFADITPESMTICPNSIERLITDKTSCILGVHVYGNPCDVVKIDLIAKKYKLFTIYDAAHAFDTKINGLPISRYGDATMFSFHATKLFNTVEGGGLALNCKMIANRVRNYRNFGITGEESVTSVGINGKMSEVHALVGLLNIEELDLEVSARKKIRSIYDEAFLSSELIVTPEIESHVNSSQQYYPIRIKKYRDLVYNELKKSNVFSRKYFYPLCSDYDCYKNSGIRQDELTNSKWASSEVLCLPFYGELSEMDARYISSCILEIIENAE